MKFPRESNAGPAKQRQPRSSRAVPQSLRDAAYEAIKDRIITCEFQPGERINEISVANLIGLGRTPVHLALDRLMLEGLVEVVPRKGVIVKPVILQDVLELIDARAVNEGYCARLAAARASDADIRTLQDIVARARRAIADRDIETMMRLDRDFHLSLGRATRNDELTEVLRKLNERSLRFWFISFTTDHHKSFQKQHEAILEAVGDRDEDAAEAAMRAHIEAFRHSVARKR